MALGAGQYAGQLDRAQPAGALGKEFQMRFRQTRGEEGDDFLAGCLVYMTNIQRAVDYELPEKDNSNSAPYF